MIEGLGERVHHRHPERLQVGPPGHAAGVEHRPRPDVQGRVFATRRLIAQITGPLGMLIAGPLADRVFEPAMSANGTWAARFGWLVGTGPGAGMGLMLVFVGLLGTTAGIVGYAVRAIRNIERIMPDHDAEPVEGGLEPATAPA